MNYTIPASLAPFVSDIYPISTFGTVSPVQLIVNNASSVHDSRDLPKGNIMQAPRGCRTSATTSACYRALYGFDSYQPGTDMGMSDGPAVGMCVQFLALLCIIIDT